MSKRASRFLSFPEACRRIGVSMYLGRRLAADRDADFPESFFLGSRRVFAEDAIDRWLDEKTGGRRNDSAAA